MAGTKDLLLDKIRSGLPMTGKEQLRLSLALGVPAILAQLSNILMQYIDASMVGHLGAAQAASIGLVSTTTWLFGGMCMAATSGFSVQVAQLIGANEFHRARRVMRKGLVSVLLFSILLGLVGLALCRPLPVWLGGKPDIVGDATSYLFVYSACIPFMQVGWTAATFLSASGNTKVPAIIYVVMCALDVVFNYLFIYVLHMGVTGAALGTAASEFTTMLITLWYLLCKSKELNIMNERHGDWRPDRQTLGKATGISGPLWIQNLVMRGAYVLGTMIVAPLGTIAIAANSFAVIAESLCYMPGYGMEDAVTALVGQSLGARRKELAKRFAWINIGIAAGMMSFLAVLMFIFAPQMMGLFTTDQDVIALGVKCLRIEAFAELFYGVSIVAYGACVGAGDTMVPAVLNFASMWVVRIGLALILTPRFGLTGYWIAMCIELNVRGILFALRVKGDKWMKKVLI